MSRAKNLNSEHELKFLAIEEGKVQVKVLIKNFDILFLFPSKQFLPISFGSSACCVPSLHHDPPPPAPTPWVLTEPVFWQKSPAGTDKQTAKTWFGLGK